MAFLFSLLLMATVTAHGAAAPSAAPVPAAAAPKRSIRVADVDAFVAPYIRHHAFSGVVLVAHGDRVLVQKAYGMANYEHAVPNTVNTRFAIASITKRFTNVILRRLIDEKKLSMDEPLSKWVPDFPSAEKITVAHLQGHRSGIRDPQKLRGRVRLNLTTAETVQELKSQPLGSVPGETYSYTTANYAVLAHILERVTGRSYTELVRTMVCAPAGMKDSGELSNATVVARLASGYMPDPLSDGVAACGPEDASWKSGGGSSYATALDLHRFHRALFGGKLMAAKAEEIFTLSKVLGRRALRSSGSFGGANAHAVYFPDDDVSVVVLSNNYGQVTGPIAEALAAMTYGAPYKVPSVELRKDVPAADARLAGKYRLGDQWPFTISIREGRTIIAYTDAPLRQSALLPMPDGSYFEPLDWAVVKFEMDAEGRITGASFNAPWSDEPVPATRLD